MTNRTRITAKLDVDEDGWPPSDFERLWGEWVEPRKIARLDNIPEYLDGYALADLVRVEDTGGEIFLRSLHESGGHSTIRALVGDPGKLEYVTALRRELTDIGCETEYDEKRGVILIDVPPQVDFASCASVLDAHEKSGGIGDYWIGALRHA